MLNRIRTLFASPSAPAPITASVPAGQRVYAFGDIHGRLDLLAELLAKVEADDAARGPADTTLVFLGDLVDRGPDSAGVIDAVMALTRRRKVRTLAGNHEEMFLGSFTKMATLRHFLRFGGRETLLSYFPDKAAYEAMGFDEVQAAMADAVPLAHREFLAGMEDMVQIGDYLFVHAGIRPDVPLEAQQPSDLRWIREPFLDHPADHGCVVVHGHTISDEVVERPNRIGIDTGAYMSGRLTAIGLEGSERWFLATGHATASADYT